MLDRIEMVLVVILVNSKEDEDPIEILHLMYGSNLIVQSGNLP